ncbi:MAG TPA: endonuclease/exonuclease/phosphatase family protein [Candidatus Paceibacterota bacterium]|nr:endonuclease/exonuclease/phosphatase family protein [Candidatus Paceibacterota bacterium]
MALSLISLNIERDRHLPAVEALLQETAPDVACLQEVFEADLPALAKAAEGEALFVPRIRYPSPRGLMPEGLAIISRRGLSDQASACYAGEKAAIPIAAIDGSVEEKQRDQRYSIASCLVEKDGASYRIVTTHFPWTPDGEADAFQRDALAGLFSVLEPLGEFVLTGDFNAPRGKEIFSAIAERYADAVPPAYGSSIDGRIHRAGPIPYMVDGLFSTQDYRISDVVMRCGVSDHCALAGAIERA